MADSDSSTPNGGTDLDSYCLAWLAAQIQATADPNPMPPRRGRARGGTVTPSSIGRNPGSVTSGRSATSRRPEDARSPMPAKYSTSYGSPMIQLPDRGTINGGGTISHAAALVYNKVERDNRKAQRRLVAANPLPTPVEQREKAPELAEDISDQPEEFSELPEEGRRGDQRQSSSDEVDLLQGQSENYQASQDDYEGGDYEGAPSPPAELEPELEPELESEPEPEPELEPELEPEPELEMPMDSPELEPEPDLEMSQDSPEPEPVPELEYDPSQGQSPEPEAEPHTQPDTQPEPPSQSSPPNPKTRLQRRKRDWDDEVAEAEAERDRVAREAYLRKQRAAELKEQADQRHATPLILSTLSVPRPHIDGTSPATVRSYIEESNVYTDTNLETPVRLTRSLRPRDPAAIRRQQLIPLARRQPVPSTQQQPAPSTQQQPVPSTQQQPVPSTQQQPVPSTQQQPGPSTQQQHVLSTQQQPVLSTRQQPALSTRQQPVLSTQQQPALSTRQQPDLSTRQQPVVSTPAPVKPPNPLALGSATTLRPPENRPNALPQLNRPPEVEEQRHSFIPQARPQKSTNSLESHNSQGLRPRPAAGKGDTVESDEDDDDDVQRRQDQEGQNQTLQRQDRRNKDRQDRDRQDQERQDQVRRDQERRDQERLDRRRHQHGQGHFGAVRNWGSSLWSSFGSLWSSIGALLSNIGTLLSNIGTLFGTLWSKFLDSDGIWSLFKALLLLMVVFCVVTLTMSGAGPRSHTRPLPGTKEDWDAVKEVADNPGDLSPESRDRLASVVTKIIMSQRDKSGKVAIDDDLWKTFKEKILRDKDVASGILGSQLLGPKWKSLLEQVKASAGSPAQSWDDWLKKNKKKLREAIKEELPAAVKEKLPAHGVTQADISREVEKVLANERSAVQARMDKAQKTVHSLAQEVSKIKSSPGMAKDDVSKLVHTAVKKAISDAKLESAAKTAAKSKSSTNPLDAELHGRMNHLAFGNGVQIDISLTSPTWLMPEEPRPWSWSWSRTPPKPPQQRPRFIREPYAALTPWDDAGDCWCAGTTGLNDTHLPADFGIQLGHLVIPEYLVVEHIHPDATVDAAAMPRDFEIWAIVGGPAADRVRDWAVASFPATYAEETVEASPVIAQTIRNGFVKIGEFTYSHVERDGGVMHHRLSQELRGSLRAATDQLLVRAVNNHGADHTCFYRVRLYGEVVGMVEKVGVGE